MNPISPLFVFTATFVFLASFSDGAVPYPKNSPSVPFVPQRAIGFFWFQTEDGQIVPAYLKPPPSPVTPEYTNLAKDCTFWHYLPGDADDAGRQITPNCTDDCLSTFVRNAPVLIFAHGFNNPEGHLAGASRVIRSGFIGTEEMVNIIIINWYKLSVAPHYFAGTINTEKVGRYTAELLQFLVAEGVTTFDKVHFAGHSLGAHIANYISANLGEGKSMRSVFALDPAAPLFDVRPKSGRLDASDADFVMVMHTSTYFMGFKTSIGHADFFPNGGVSQPECGSTDDAFGNCSHNLVLNMFRDSVRNYTRYRACQCDSWDAFEDGSCDCSKTEVMGWKTARTGAKTAQKCQLCYPEVVWARGAFYLSTVNK